jgi:predicted CoA-binding protein
MLAARRIAVVGMSADPDRAGHYVPAFLRARGKQVIPVNPNHTEIDGLTSYPSLADIPRGGDDQGIDVVLVFRRPEYCADVAKEAAAIAAGGLWLQSGIYSEDARRIAADAGMNFVQGRCMMVEYGDRRET